MDLADYFENHQGLGILATADSDGTVDLAIYAKPHVVNENTVTFVMQERLTHQNFRSTLHAAYMFVDKLLHVQLIHPINDSHQMAKRKKES